MIFSLTRGVPSFPTSFTAAGFATALLVLPGFVVCLTNLSCSLSTGVSGGEGAVAMVTSLLVQSSGKVSLGPCGWEREEEDDDDEEEEEGGMEV